MNPFHLPSAINKDNNLFYINHGIAEIDDGLDLMKKIIERVGTLKDTIQARKNLLKLQQSINDKITKIKQEINELGVDDIDEYNKIFSTKLHSLRCLIETAIEKFSRYTPMSDDQNDINCFIGSTETSPLLTTKRSYSDNTNDSYYDLLNTPTSPLPLPLHLLSNNSSSRSSNYSNYIGDEYETKETEEETKFDALFNDLDEIVRRQELIATNSKVITNLQLDQIHQDKQQENDGQNNTNDINDSILIKSNNIILLILVLFAIIALIAAVWTYFAGS